MATIVCQCLQSCPESQLVDSRTLRLILSSPKTHCPRPLELALKPCFLDYNTKEFQQQFQKSTPDYGRCSFIQALSDTCTSSKEAATQEEKPYVHPQIRRALSDKSLELCTENLGSETGTDITEDSIFSLSSSNSKAVYSPTREQQKPRQHWSSRKRNSRCFPPPLTTISGSESVQIRPHREGGRLIIEAIKDPSTHTHFQAERSHGRLRLSLFKDSPSSPPPPPPSFDYFNDGDNEENEEEFENDSDNELVAEEIVVEEEMEVDGNRSNVGNEIGSEKINQRPSSCKEGEQEKKNGLLNWENYCVATS